MKLAEAQVQVTLDKVLIRVLASSFHHVDIEITKILIEMPQSYVVIAYLRFLRQVIW